MSGRFNVGDKVFAKLRGYPPWPAKVTSLPNGCKGNKYCVMFYGTLQIGYCKEDDLFPYLSHKDKFTKRLRTTSYLEALLQIEGLSPTPHLGTIYGSKSVEKTEPIDPEQNEMNNEQPRKVTVAIKEEPPDEFSEGPEDDKYDSFTSNLIKEEIKEEKWKAKLLDEEDGFEMVQSADCKKGKSDYGLMLVDEMQAVLQQLEATFSDNEDLQEHTLEVEDLTIEKMENTVIPEEELLLPKVVNVVSLSHPTDSTQLTSPNNFKDAREPLKRNGCDESYRSTAPSCQSAPQEWRHPSPDSTSDGLTGEHNPKEDAMALATQEADEGNGGMEHQEASSAKRTSNGHHAFVSKCSVNDPIVPVWQQWPALDKGDCTVMLQQLSRASCKSGLSASERSGESSSVQKEDAAPSVCSSETVVCVAAVSSISGSSFSCDSSVHGNVKTGCVEERSVKFAQFSRKYQNLGLLETCDQNALEGGNTKGSKRGRRGGRVRYGRWSLQRKIHASGNIGKRAHLCKEMREPISTQGCPVSFDYSNLETSDYCLGGGIPVRNNGRPEGEAVAGCIDATCNDDSNRTKHFKLEEHIATSVEKTLKESDKCSEIFEEIGKEERPKFSTLDHKDRLRCTIGKHNSKLALEIATVEVDPQNNDIKEGVTTEGCDIDIVLHKDLQMQSLKRKCKIKENVQYEQVNSDTDVSQISRPRNVPNLYDSIKNRIRRKHSGSKLCGKVIPCVKSPKNNTIIDAGLKSCLLIVTEEERIEGKSGETQLLLQSSLCVESSNKERTMHPSEKIEDSNKWRGSNEKAVSCDESSKEQRQVIRKNKREKNSEEKGREKHSLCSQNTTIADSRKEQTSTSAKVYKKPLKKETAKERIKESGESYSSKLCKKNKVIGAIHDLDTKKAGQADNKKKVRGGLCSEAIASMAYCKQKTSIDVNQKLHKTRKTKERNNGRKVGKSSCTQSFPSVEHEEEHNTINTKIKIHSKNTKDIKWRLRMNSSNSIPSLETHNKGQNKFGGSLKVDTNGKMKGNNGEQCVSSGEGNGNRDLQNVGNMKTPQNKSIDCRDVSFLCHKTIPFSESQKEKKLISCGYKADSKVSENTNARNRNQSKRFRGQFLLLSKNPNEVILNREEKNSDNSCKSELKIVKENGIDNSGSGQATLSTEHPKIESIVRACQREPDCRSKEDGVRKSSFLLGQLIPFSESQKEQRLIYGNHKLVRCQGTMAGSIKVYKVSKSTDRVSLIGQSNFHGKPAKECNQSLSIRIVKEHSKERSEHRSGKPSFHESSKELKVVCSKAEICFKKREGSCSKRAKRHAESCCNQPTQSVGPKRIIDFNHKDDCVKDNSKGTRVCTSVPCVRDTSVKTLKANQECKEELCEHNRIRVGNNNSTRIFEVYGVNMLGSGCAEIQKCRNVAGGVCDTNLKHSNPDAIGRNEQCLSPEKKKMKFNHLLREPDFKINTEHNWKQAQTACCGGQTPSSPRLHAVAMQRAGGYGKERGNYGDQKEETCERYSLISQKTCSDGYQTLSKFVLKESVQHKSRGRHSCQTLGKQISKTRQDIVNGERNELHKTDNKSEGSEKNLPAKESPLVQQAELALRSPHRRVRTTWSGARGQDSIAAPLLFNRALQNNAVEKLPTCTSGSDTMCHICGRMYSMQDFHDCGTIDIKPFKESGERSGRIDKSISARIEQADTHGKSEFMCPTSFKIEKTQRISSNTVEICSEQNTVVILKDHATSARAACAEEPLEVLGVQEQERYGKSSFELPVLHHIQEKQNMFLARNDPVSASAACKPTHCPASTGGIHNDRTPMTTCQEGIYTPELQFRNNCADGSYHNVKECQTYISRNVTPKHLHLWNDSQDACKQNGGEEVGVRCLGNGTGRESISRCAKPAELMKFHHGREGTKSMQQHFQVRMEKRNLMEEFIDYTKSYGAQVRLNTNYTHCHKSSIEQKYWRISVDMTQSEERERQNIVVRLQEKPIASVANINLCPSKGSPAKSELFVPLKRRKLQHMPKREDWMGSTGSTALAAFGNIATFGNMACRAATRGSPDKSVNQQVMHSHLHELCNNMKNNTYSSVTSMSESNVVAKIMTTNSECDSFNRETIFEARKESSVIKSPSCMFPGCEKYVTHAECSHPWEAETHSKLIYCKTCSKYLEHKCPGAKDIMVNSYGITAHSVWICCRCRKAFIHKDGFEGHRCRADRPESQEREEE